MPQSDACWGYLKGYRNACLGVREIRLVEGIERASDALCDRAASNIRDWETPVPTRAPGEGSTMSACEMTTAPILMVQLGASDRAALCFTACRHGILLLSERKACRGVGERKKIQAHCPGPQIWSCNRMQTERKVLAIASQAKRMSRSCAHAGAELGARAYTNKGGAA